jgi:hypothetical protein
MKNFLIFLALTGNNDTGVDHHSEYLDGTWSAKNEYFILVVIAFVLLFILYDNKKGKKTSDQSRSSKKQVK